MTISAHISCAVISGTQPNLFFAFDGSPNNVSTSAGLKYLGSIFIITSPTFNAGARSPSIFSIVAISSIPLPEKENIDGDLAPALKVGDVIIKIDPRYFRPAEVETLLGDPSKAKNKLGWVPEITAQEMCAEMVIEDYKAARRVSILKDHGLELPVSLED